MSPKTTVGNMLGNHLFAAPLGGVLARVLEWPVTAQQHARRNAMIAATACAARRVEREEVADFLRSNESPAVETDAAPTADPARSHG